MTSSNQRVFFALAFAPAVIVILLAFTSVPRFIELYRMFDAALPISTAILFRWYHVFAFIPMVFVLVWLAWPNRGDRGTAALVTSLLLSVIVVVLGYMAAYAPLATLSATP